MPEINLGRVLGAPDYEQNDPGLAGYIKNRPFYADLRTVEWDGTAEGSDSLDIGGVTYYRVSALTPGREELIGQAVTMALADGTNAEISITEAICVEPAAGFRYITHADMPYIVIADASGTVSCDGADITVPAAGVYAAQAVTSLSLAFGTVKKMEQKFLPEGTSPVKVIDIGDVQVDLTAIDFSTYKTGDVILIVGNT